MNSQQNFSDESQAEPRTSGLPPSISSEESPSTIPPPPPTGVLIQPPQAPLADQTSSLSAEQGNSGETGRGFPVKTVLIVLGIIFSLLVAGFGLFRYFSGKTASPALVNLTWWGLWEDSSIVQPLIDEYQAKNPNIKIQYLKQSPKDYRERLNSSLAKGTGPDIFRFHNSWIPMFKSELASLPSDVIDSATFASIFYPVASQSLMRSGQILGIPLMIDGLGLYINEEIFARSNLSPPQTWDELRRRAVSLTARSGEGEILQAGVALGTAGNVDHWQDILSLMLMQNQADLANLTDKSAQDSLSFYTNFVTGDRVWDQTLPPSTSAFAAGKLAMYFAPSWRAFEIKSKNPALRFHIVPVPQLPKSTPPLPGEVDVTWTSFWSEGVWGRSQNKKQAFEFLKFLSQREQLEKLYTEAAKIRLFGEPYPRRDMSELLTDHPMVGAYIKQASNAKSWYLASNTFDGPTGINSRISKYFEDAVNKVLEGDSPERVLPTVQQGVQQVLGTYEIR